MHRRRDKPHRAEWVITLTGIILAGLAFWWGDRQVRKPFAFASARLVAQTTAAKPQPATKIIDLGYATIAVPRDFPETFVRVEDTPLISLDGDGPAQRGFFGAPQNVHSSDFVDICQQASALLNTDEPLSWFELQLRALDAQPFGLLDRLINGKVWTEQQTMLLGVKQMRFWNSERVEILESDDVDVILDHRPDEFSIDAFHRESGLWLHFTGKPPAMNPHQIANALLQHLEPSAGWRRGEPVPALIAAAGIPILESPSTDASDADLENALQSVVEEVLRRRKLRAQDRESAPSP